VRLDHVQDMGSAASPWAQVAFSITPRWRLQAAHGWHRQAPDLLQRSGPNGGPPLRMERARHTDVGLAWQAGAWSAGLTAYDRREDDVLDTPGRWPRVSADGRVFHGDPLAPWVNGLGGTAQGAEVVVRRQAAGWSGWVSYATGRLRYAYGAGTASFPSAFEQSQLFSATASVRPRDRWDASATMRLASNWPYEGFYESRDGRVFLSDERNALRLPTYARVDVRVRHVVPLGSRRLVIFGEAINLLNRRNIRQVEGSYDSRTLEVFRISERQLPIIPSIGLAFEF
jgi:outer membrane cobalamin receptor